MPRMTASADARRRAALAPGGNAADNRAKAPVLMMPPKTCAASCWPPEKALSGSLASRCWVLWTDGMVIAVARTSAMVGNKAAKISTRSPPARRSAGPGAVSSKSQVTTASTVRITRLSQRSRASVRRMNIPKASAPVVATGPDGCPRAITQIAAIQAMPRHTSLTWRCAKARTAKNPEFGRSEGMKGPASKALTKATVRV